uniref:Uncharacterized protein n=1 Tax=Pipistrellus kuhlii TaxID=59472 RepID=A0A7J7R356_PIPKU|nr:hypothetical protein mPipKuh1_007986 [Pipistrellus kuhlii]
MERPGPPGWGPGGRRAAVPGPRCPPSCHSALVTRVSEAVRLGDRRPALPVDAPARPHYVPTSQPHAGDGQARDRTSAPVDELPPCLEHSLLFPRPPTPTPVLAKCLLLQEALPTVHVLHGIHCTDHTCNGHRSDRSLKFLSPGAS